MKYSSEIKNIAINLREKGYSLAEIAKKLNLSKSTASLWSREVELSSIAKNRINKRKILGVKNAVLWKTKQRESLSRKNKIESLKILKKIRLDKNIYKLFSCLLWWCEGNKSTTIVRFTSSDISLIKNYLSFFRKSFDLDEKKFRVIMHLHRYHNEEKQKAFWGEATGIPMNQFWKTYIKPNTGKRIHKDYPGCIAITYFDARIAKELEALYNTLSQIGA